MQSIKPHPKNILIFERFQIPYRIFGKGEDIICLNGVQQSMAMWLSFVKRFGHCYRITLFDFPHQGKAKINSGLHSVSFDEQVRILHAIIKESGIKSADICTASWGGVVALAFALRFPQHVKRLLLASIGIKPNTCMKDVILKGTAMNKHDRQAMADLLINSFGDNLPQALKNQIIAQFQSMSEERIRAFSEHGMSVIFNESLDKVIPLSEVTKPVVILYGGKDKIIDYKDVKSMAKQMPNCAIKVIPNVGHFLHLESEKVFDTYEEILFPGNVPAHQKSRHVAPIL
ncbi:MAG: alpha/beta hydrolase [Candidatus Omnitrophota bacterium]|jgi:2-succinyl-6-hydroxy-2,4-cyclohexadiene-1-carboxylate synthase